MDRTTIDRGNARPLNEVVAHWPTPDASVINDGESPATFHARRERLKASHKNGNGAGTPLTVASAQWTAPQAHDVAPGNPARVGRYGTKHGGRDLTDQVTVWNTPSVADVTGGHKSRSGARKNEPLLNGQAEDLSSLLAPQPLKTGGRSPTSHLSAYLRYRATTCSELRLERRSLLLMGLRRRDTAKPGEIRRLRRGWTKTAPTAFVRPSFRKSLNPHFVGDLMGWPPGLTSFACSETASLIWRARMRSALSQLTSHAAPPAQPDLFG